MTSQRQIKTVDKRLRDRLTDLEGQIEVTWAEIRVNQKKCSHPKQYTYSAMGELGIKCPDCGYQT